MALFHNNSNRNYLVTLIVFLGIIALLAALAFLLTYYFPGSFAGPPVNYEIKELYSFEPWAFRLGDLGVSYPGGGLILPLYRNDKQEAAIIFAQGDYELSGHQLPDQNPAGIFMVIDGNLFDEIRGCVIFMPSEDAEARHNVECIYEQQPGLPVIWNKVIPLTFVPAADSIYYYFISEKGEVLLPPTLDEPPSRLYSSLALYATLIAIILLMLTIFSLDHRPSRYWENLYQAAPGKNALLPAGAAVLPALGGELLPLFKDLPDYSFLFGYLVSFALLLTLSYLKIIDLRDTALRRNVFHRGYFMAAAAALMFMLITRGVPHQCPIEGPKSIAVLFFSIFIVGLARELIWRGYIQTMLGRQWGATAGLLLTALLAGLVHFIIVALGTPELLSYPYTMVELLVLAPGSAIVLGYLYLRTENIVCCALLHGLLLSLSSLTII